MNGTTQAEGQVSNKIQELEVQLEKKDKELAIYKQRLHTLTDAFDKNAHLFHALLEQLNAAETQLKNSHKSVDSVIGQLSQDNNNLRISNDMWLKRVIKLELEMLSAKELYQQTEKELSQARNKLRWLIS